MMEAALAISFLVLTIMIAAGLSMLWFGRPPKAGHLKHASAALAFALDHLSWSEGRRFLRIFRTGREDALAARFPKWREFRDRFEAIEKDHTA